MVSANCIRLFFAFLLVCMSMSLSMAQDSDINLQNENSSEQNENYDRYIDIKIPQGFVAENVEESGIHKWKKDSAEIYLIIGDLFSSAKTTFDSLKEGAKANSKIEVVQDLKLQGGQAFMYKEKPSDDPGRLRMWRIIIVTKDKMMTIDLSAPTKDFPNFINDFSSAANSIKLK